jgi:hypothetical protein
VVVVVVVVVVGLEWGGICVGWRVQGIEAGAGWLRGSETRRWCGKVTASEGASRRRVCSWVRPLGALWGCHLAGQ